MDIKAIAEQIVSKLKANPNLLKEFTSDPVQTIKKVAGIDIPTDMINDVVKEVKEKLGNGEDGIGGILGKLGSLFKK